jgi:hypothetical protein
MTQMFGIRRQGAGWLIRLIVLAAVAIALPSQGQSPQPLPSPDEAVRRASQVSPEALPGQLADLEIDAATRDRLRFDPAWQPMVQAVRQDLMSLKWGDSQLPNSVWQRYGANAYPLLDYYARSADPTRQAYGMLGIRQLGKPYTTLWLERQLQRRSAQPSVYLLTASRGELLTPSGAGPSSPVDWQQEFGLDDPATRDRLVQLARRNLEPATSPTYYDQFNLNFLIAVLGYEAVLPTQAESQPAPNIPQWDSFEKLTQPSAEQVQQAIASYQQLPRDAQDYILVNRLGPIKAGEISAAGRAFLQALASDAKSPDRLWAIAELDRHGDPQGSTALQSILNGNLEELYPLTELVSYPDRSTTNPDKATHAYYLLVGMAKTYPDSRFIRAAREYGNLTGRTYFGGEPRSQTSVAAAAAKPAAQRTISWQSWLDRYPDHPGADDATYFIARGWQDQNQIMAAFDLWVQLMTQRVGDSDAVYLAYPHVRTLLDVGLSLTQMEKLPQLYRSTAIAPLLRYALAVRYARNQDYAKALQTSEALDLTTMPDTVLGSYYRSFGQGAEASQNRYQPQAVQQQMQAMLTEQRQRWQRLQQLQADGTPAARYQIASDWAGEGGWKNGYLALWDDSRIAFLPTGDWSTEFCQIFWSCNVALRGADAVRSSYQQASQMAIALSLYQALLSDPATPAPLREKVLFMSASTLLAQWEDYPLGETIRIHPPAGVEATAPLASPDEHGDGWQRQYHQIEQNYLNQLDRLITQLQQQFPKSQYIDDLLFSRYAMSGQPRYLETIVQNYPDGDRAAEAQFLLAHRRQ